jgi:hypothetical protein
MVLISICSSISPYLKLNPMARFFGPYTIFCIDDRKEYIVEFLYGDLTLKSRHICFQRDTELFTTIR